MIRYYIRLYSFSFILNNLIVLSSDPETKMPELNCAKQFTHSVCSLIVISGLKVFILYIIIVQSLEPEANLPSFKTVKQFMGNE